MPKMSMGERSRSWTASIRRTPMRVVGLEAIFEIDVCWTSGLGRVQWCLGFGSRWSFT